MAKMEQSSLLIKSDSKAENSIPVFDSIFTTIINFPSNHRDIEKISWVNENISAGKVSVKFANDQVYMAFEDKTDALIFKIRYLL